MAKLRIDYLGSTATMNCSACGTEYAEHKRACVDGCGRVFEPSVQVFINGEEVNPAAERSEAA